MFYVCFLVGHSICSCHLSLPFVGYSVELLCCFSHHLDLQIFVACTVLRWSGVGLSGNVIKYVSSPCMYGKGHTLLHLECS